MAEYKTCSRCKESKPYTDYYPNAARRDGVSTYCRPCVAERYVENRDHLLAKQKVYYEAHREESAERSRRWRVNNPERAALNDAMKKGRLKDATPPWVDPRGFRWFVRQRKAMSERFGVRFQIDHIYPLSHRQTGCCGLNVTWNLRIITAEENNRKKDKHPNG